MRPFLTILSCFITTLAFSQTLTDKYLHFKQDHYLDTTLYKSEQSFYYEVNLGTIIEKNYPVLQYLYTNVVSDTPLVTIDSFARRNIAGYPYKYIRKGNFIYLRYFDLQKHQLQLHKEYSLDIKDTVKWLAEKGSLDSRYGISVDGFSTYLGEATLKINDKEFSVFRFLEDHYQPGSHPSYYTTEIYLEKKTLIPIKFITTHYDYKTRQKQLYNSITVLASSGNTLPDYTNKKTDDLVLYENKSTAWTEKQKQEFLENFSPNMRPYADCLLKKLDGRISYFNFKQNIYFKRLIVGKECE